TRVLDTRDATGTAAPGPVAQATEVAFDVGAAGRVPVGTTAVLDVVATNAVAAGFVTLHPCGTPLPPTSSVNALVGNDATNVAVVGVDAQDRVCAFVSQTMDLVVDVIGTFGAGGPLHGLDVDGGVLDQTFSPDAHDYTIRCATGTNSMRFH